MGLRAVLFADAAPLREAVRSALGRTRKVALAAAEGTFSRAGSLLRDHRPDVVILGLDPVPDPALTFLDRLMTRYPIPVVVLASGDGYGSRSALRAMELGAVEAVDARRVLRGGAGGTELRLAVVAAAAARRSPAFQRFVEAARRRRANPLQGAHHTVIAMGASTGGTEALHRILPQLPAVTPGVLITQHMPAGFTRAFAERLNHTCEMEVREACDGDRVESGLVLVAPGDRHLRLRPGLRVSLDSGPRVNRHRPSVDVLFHSVASVCGDDAVGLILTGMGADGADGLRAMREHGAVTFAQDEETCVVYGMPQEAVNRGGAERVLPLDRIPPALLHAVLQKTDAIAAPGARTG